ncbi:MAG: hypothetical protein MZV49_15135 [Rhodopseudomonas palustris]|nr:hypothetical protein [Rhodopseudomonas palustris]
MRSRDSRTPRPSSRLEDLYLPYKPKRRTKAEIAREAGLEPLADLLLRRSAAATPQAAAACLRQSPTSGVADAKAALDGARQILMEQLRRGRRTARRLREHLWSSGVMTAKRARRARKDQGAKFR